jgi:hypothetical protein
MELLLLDLGQVAGDVVGCFLPCKKEKKRCLDDGSRSCPPRKDGPQKRTLEEKVG